MDAKSPDPHQLKAWLLATGRSDPVAFRSLYDATAPKLFAFALRILSKRELAEEVLQESFVAIWNHAASYQCQLSAPMTWLSTIVRNKAFDQLRRNNATPDLDGQPFDDDIMNALLDPHASPIESLHISNDAKALAWCMAALEGMQRQVLALAYFHDLSHNDVAQHLQLPIGTVKTWVRRSLDKLRTCMGKREQA
jgi:RNA polymerase sigma-70 factor (ECF subfamily)